MKQPKGVRLGGRKKGTPNKITERTQKTLLELCEKHKFSPFEALIDMAQHSGEEAIRLGALKEACKYVYPQLKQVEHRNEAANKLVEQAEAFINMTEEQLVAMAKAELKKAGKA